MHSTRMEKEYWYICVVAALAALASLIHSLNLGFRGMKLVWRMFEASLIGAVSAAMLYFRFGWPIYLVGAVCLVMGLVAAAIVLRLNGLVAALADRVEKEVRDGAKPAVVEPEAAPEKPEAKPEETEKTPPETGS